MTPPDPQQQDGVEVWQEPIRGGYPRPELLALSGRERLETWRTGRNVPPPLFYLTGARPTSFGDGTTEAQMPASGWLLNAAGVINGGTLAVLADIAFGCSIETRLPPATPYTTAEISLTFLRPARADGMLSAHGRAIHTGRSVALSEAHLMDSDGRLIAHGTSRCAILPKLEQLPEPQDLDAQLPEPPSYDTPDPFERPAPGDGLLEQEVWERLSGAEILDRQISGEFPPPPISRLTGVRVVSFGDGTAEAVLPAHEWLASPLRLLQGGTLAMLADVAMLVAVQSRAPAGIALAGLDLKINYLRPAPPDGRDLLARAEVIHSGRTLAIARTAIENADGKKLALATSSAMYLPGRPASLGEGELGP